MMDGNTMDYLEGRNHGWGDALMRDTVGVGGKLGPNGTEAYAQGVLDGATLYHSGYGPDGSKMPSYPEVS